jgi:hypothetical protein
MTPLDSGETLYASSRTRAAHDAWKGGAGCAARLIGESTLDTEALREKVLTLARDA